jgi:peptidoglycan/xylan/chitin deacetylase (PgdA/CDA1 family)
VSPQSTSAVVVIAVDPALNGMSRLADRLEGAPFLPGRQTLILALSEAREISAQRGRLPVVAILPSNHPTLVPIAATRGADRIAIYHTVETRLSRLQQIALRAAFSVIDRTIVPDEASMRSAIRLGADPDRIAFLGDRLLRRIIAEPRRRDSAMGAVEAFVSLALDAAETTGVIRLAEMASKKGVNVVNYHRVLPIDELRVYGRPQMAIAAPLFEAQIEAIAGLRGFTSLDRVRDTDADGKVAITFDDGYEDNFRVALPILQRFSTPACIFVVTNLIGQPQALWWDRVGLSLFAYWRSGAEKPIPPGLPRRARALQGTESFEEARRIISEVLGELNDFDEEARAKAITDAEALVPQEKPHRTMLSWEEIEEMKRLGILFGSHTRNHVCLDQVPPEVARDELLGSQVDLEEKLGTNGSTLRVAALPRGRLGPIDEGELKAKGFFGVMTTDPGVNDPKDGSLFVLRRDGKYLTLRGRHHPAKLRLELTGLVDLLRTKNEH